MNNLLRLGVLLFVSITQFELTTMSLAQNRNVEQDVLLAVEQLGEAYRTGDVQALRALTTENYIHINGGSGSRINREQWLSWVGSQKELLDSGDLHINTYEISDLTVEIYGETAFVTGIVKSEGIRNEEPFGVHVRFSNVWRRLEGNWLRAAFHDSRIPD